MSKNEKEKCKNPLCNNYFKPEHGHNGLCPKCYKNLKGGGEIGLSAILFSVIGWAVSKIIKK